METTKAVCFPSKQMTERKFRFFAYVFYLCATFFTFPSNLSAQELKPLREYENSLKLFYRQKRHIERVEYQVKKVKPYWFYLPDVGFSFGRPSISFRLSNVFDYKRQNYQNDVKLLSIDYHTQLEMNEKMKALQIAYQKLLLENEKLEISKEKQKKLNELFSISQECCRRLECTPEVCKQRELENLTQIEAIRVQELNFKIAILSLEEMAKYNFPNFDFVR